MYCGCGSDGGRGGCGGGGGWKEDLDLYDLVEECVEDRVGDRRIARLARGD